MIHYFSEPETTHRKPTMIATIPTAAPAQFRIQAEQLDRFTGPGRTDLTWFRSPMGEVAFVQGSVNPAIRLHADRMDWVADALTPLEYRALCAGTPAMQLIPTGPYAVKSRDNWDDDPAVEEWLHGAIQMICLKPLSPA